MWARRPRRWWLAGLLAFALSAGCGRGEVGAPKATTEADLRLRLAASPRDQRANRDLARLLLATARPGAAVRHFERARSALSPADRVAFADLYIRRARARLAAGDLLVGSDLRAAARLGQSPIRIDRELAREALFAEALAAYRRADRLGRSQGAAALERARAEFGDDRRLAAARPALASVAEVGEAAAWLADGDAKRVALDLYRAYAERGGTERNHLRRHRSLEVWWGRVSRSKIAASTLPVADALVLALRAWLRGEATSWRSPLEARLAALSAADLPPFARATILRWQGEDAAAARALVDALLEAPSLTSDERAVVLTEALLVGRPAEALAELARGDLEVLALARAARARSDYATLESMLSTASLALRRTHHLTGAELDALARADTSKVDRLALRGAQRLRVVAPGPARTLVGLWRAMGHREAPRSQGWVAPIGAVDAARLAVELGMRGPIDELVRIARIYTTEPVLAERLAFEFIDRRVAVIDRAPIVAELFGRAGDPRRALSVVEHWLAASPDHPPALEAAAIWAASSGDVARAKVLAAKAAARSGDAGRTWRRMTASFLAAGARLAAVSAGRSALALSAPHHHGPLKATIARAMLRMGRVADARDLVRGEPFANELLAAAGRVIDSTDARANRLRDAPDLPQRAADPSDPAAALANHRASPSTDSLAALATARSWNVANVALNEALAATAHKDARLARAQLAALALAPGPQRGAAMRAWARRLDAEGNEALADALRREAAAATAVDQPR